VAVLSPAQLDALSNLARKKAGDDVGWVAIAQARELTELGLALRTRSGWEITEAGEAVLQEHDAARPDDPPDAPIPFGPRGQSADS
jgi:hypothetical protein